MRRLLMLLVLVVTAGCSTDETDEPAQRAAVTVERRADLPSPRTEVAGARFGEDELMVAGGMTVDGSPSDLVHVYDPSTDEWTEAPRLPVPLHHTALVNARGRVFVIGGYTVDGESDRVWSLAAGEGSWRDEPKLHQPRGAHGAAVTPDGTIVVFGGVSRGEVLDTSLLLRDGQMDWSRGPTLSQPREHVAATTIGNRVFAIGGRIGSLESNLGTVESWDIRPRDDEWTEEPRLNDARGGTAASGRCVAGGEEPQGTIASVECLDGDGESWSVVTELEVPRHGVAVVALKDRIHVVAGGDKPGLFVTGTHEVIDLER